LAQDSSRPDFWDTRFRGGVTPWDAGGVPKMLSVFLQKTNSGKTVLIPGCGSGYEVKAFADRGHDVLAIDFSDAAVEAARVFLGPLAAHVRKEDFFCLAEKDFDVVYERAFLCALPRKLWPQWAARMGELVKPGGVLAGFFFIDDNEKGPPFGVAPHALRQLLQSDFSLEEHQAIPADQSIPVFEGKEVWQVWRRKL